MFCVGCLLLHRSVVIDLTSDILLLKDVVKVYTSQNSCKCRSEFTTKEISLCIYYKLTLLRP